MIHPSEAMRVTGDISEGSNDHWLIESFAVDNDRDQIRQQKLEALLYTGRSCPAGEYTRLLRLTERGKTLVMSDTPDELRDAGPIFRQVQHRKAQRIIVNGLGMGCVVKGFLELSHVERIDVVEISQPLVDLMFQVASWTSDPKVRIHVADAYQMKWPVGTRWDVAWHDVWDTLDEINIPEYSRLNRMYGGRVEYQEAWGHELVKTERRIWTTLASAQT